MPNYQIKLTPVDTYYFGGEKHDAELKINYFVESNNYPQQTTLLGVLRYYLLLRENKLLNKNSGSKERNEAGQLIGNKSFSFNGGNTFGKINSISHLYFQHQNSAYHFSPFDVDFEWKEENIMQKGAKKFNAKDHNITSHQLISRKQNKMKLNDIVKVEEQVGNKIVKPGSNNKEGFYKMFKNKLAKDWSFAFDAAIDIEGLDKETNFIPFGGEKSIFKIEMKKIEPPQTLLPSNYHRSKPMVCLLSDAFVDNKTMQLADFAVNQFVSFRCMTSDISTTTHFNDLPNKNSTAKGLTRSKRYQLLQRGSVIYFKENSGDRQTFTDELDKTSGGNIGFNKYLTN